jgi:YegS/Rv2252/BmrU family lipid kinase
VAVLTPRRVLLVVNPASRRGGGLATRAYEALRDAGIVADLVATEYRGHAAEIAASLAARVDAVFTLGGDGTAVEVMSGLAGTSTPVGILPGGTGNQIARAVGIPGDVRAAVRALLGGAARPIDLGRLGDGRRFALAVGVGPDVDMIADTPASAKRRLGRLAYSLSAFRAITRNRRFVARVQVDEVRVEREVSAVIIANMAGVENGRVTFGPGIAPDDGRLDVCLYDWAGVRNAAETFWRAGTGGIAGDPSATFLSGREVRIETTPIREAEADGELIGATPLEATVEPLAVHLLLPVA